MQAMSERFWDYAQWVVDRTNMMLPLHVLALTGQAQASPALAYRTANAFNDPRDGHRHCYLPQDYGPVPGAVTIIPTGNGAASPRLRFVR